MTQEQRVLGRLGGGLESSSGRACARHGAGNLPATVADTVRWPAHLHCPQAWSRWDASLPITGPWLPALHLAAHVQNSVKPFSFLFSSLLILL